jgi:hypothetical protein
VKSAETFLLVFLAATLQAQAPLTQTLPRGFESLPGTLATTWGFGHLPGTSQRDSRCAARFTPGP